MYILHVFQKCKGESNGDLAYGIYSGLTQQLDLRVSKVGGTWGCCPGLVPWALDSSNAKEISSKQHINEEVKLGFVPAIKDARIMLSLTPTKQSTQVASFVEGSKWQ